MRTLLGPLALVVLAVMPLACASSSQTEHGSLPQKPETALSTTVGKSCAMQSGGRIALRLTVPEDTKCTSEEGSLKLNSHDRRVELWMAKSAHSVSEEVERVSQDIKDEFKDFKATSTSELSVAGAPAKRLFGAGVEADDGDPGRADIIVFKAGDHVFVACTHGEHLSQADQDWLLAVVQIAQAS